jgi:hypothetical protein
LRKGDENVNTKIKINNLVYKKFKAALMLTGNDEQAVLSRLLNEYANDVFKNSLNQNNNGTNEENEVISEKEQRELFVNWFKNLNKNGKKYNLATVSGYAGRIENACADNVFASVPVDNLFAIKDIDTFVKIKNQIKACNGYAEFDAKSHNGFTAALRKYEEFLRFQENKQNPDFINSLSNHETKEAPSNYHRWTVEEDEICCKMFLEYYVIRQGRIDIARFLQMLSEEVPEVSKGSLRMKMQNIKYLSQKAGLNDTFPLKWLSQCSSQCEKAFEKVLLERNLKIK